MKRAINVIILLYIYCLIVMNNSAFAKNSNDEYLRGYIESLFVNNYALPKEAVKVNKGIIYIEENQLKGQNIFQIQEKIEHASQHLKSFKGVKIINGNDAKNSKIGDKNISAQSKNNNSEIDGTLPNNSLFEPLIADPKWPRFTLAYQYHSINRTLKHAFAPNFGASFALYRGINKTEDFIWEIGIQAGLFAIMDIGITQSALINADYYVSMPFSYQWGSYCGLIRAYHISSHLGDEFMLTKEGQKTKRINLSYEGIDILFSYKLDMIRLYGGGGYIVHKDPGYVKPLKLQTGGEYYFSSTYLNGRLRPLIGIDIKMEENSSWTPGLSVKAGVQLENSTLISNKLQLMLEYYSGKSMHGQFYKDKIQYIGIGLHSFL